MATFKASEADRYGGSGGAGFFSISQNKGTKTVRFLYNNIDDVEGMSVHKVQAGTTKDGKPRYRYVNCLRNYNDPLDVCPFCASKKYPVQARLFVPVYNIDEDEVQIWDRGKTMFAQLSSLFSRYANNGKQFVNCVFEIERNGDSGDKKTTYMIYYVSEDDSQLEDFPESKDVLGTGNSLVLDATADDMNYYLTTGKFPETDGAGNNTEPAAEMPIRRRSAERRTPATTNRGEAF